MNALERHIEEIIRYKKAIEETDSTYLKNDYAKHIHQLKKELKEYCYYRGYDFKGILKVYKI